ncbi:MAG TPA: hypothetical protein DCM28_23735 [Phycisphaerales bacterium]|nr:hypothetical protein [Phycisphaerales bacterium]HCD32528.1 hypothetical protein [Phycisphaerales bacterium]
MINLGLKVTVSWMHVIAQRHRMEQSKVPVVSIWQVQDVKSNTWQIKDAIMRQNSRFRASFSGIGFANRQVTPSGTA